MQSLGRVWFTGNAPEVHCNRILQPNLLAGQSFASVTSNTERVDIFQAGVLKLVELFQKQVFQAKTVVFVDRLYPTSSVDRKKWGKVPKSPQQQ
jgi:hypothetical protein